MKPFTRLEFACQRETGAALVLHDAARDYAAGDLMPEQLLSAAYRYAKARDERERIQDVAV